MGEQREVCWAHASQCPQLPFHCLLTGTTLPSEWGSTDFIYAPELPVGQAEARRSGGRIHTFARFPTGPILRPNPLSLRPRPVTCLRIPVSASASREPRPDRVKATVGLDTPGGGLSQRGGPGPAAESDLGQPPASRGPMGLDSVHVLGPSSDLGVG